MRRLRNLSLLLFAFIFFSPNLVVAQESGVKSDYELMFRQDFSNPAFKKQKRSFMLLKNRNPVVRYNPVSLGFGLALYTYQNVVSRQFSASCLYSPSCSEFGKQLITRYGLFKGVFLTADRIMRCNRIAATGFKPSEVDPADERIHETTDDYHRHR